MELSKRIRNLRKEKGYTQKELAKLLGIGQTTVANYEQGIRIPDTEMLKSLADLFEVTLDYLVGREEDVLKSKIEANNLYNNIHIDESYKIYLEFLLDGKKDKARNVILSLYHKGYDFRDIYFKVLEKALKEVGVLWEKGEIDVWREHYISEATVDIMRELKPRNKKILNRSHSLLALTSGPELHNIGLRMITDILESEGWRVSYLGSNVPVQSLIKAIEIEKPEVVAISVTIKTHIDSAKYLIEAIKNKFGNKAPKIVIGGGAFSDCGGERIEIGADKLGTSAEDIFKMFK